MSTYTFFTDLEAAEKFAELMRQEHGHVNGIHECVYDKDTKGFRVEMFRGMVVGERERNQYHDSDFFAIWYDKETDRSGEFEFASTRGWTYANGCHVDADEETKAAWIRSRERAAAAANRRRAEAEAAAAAKIPNRGTRVRVKSNRSKVPHGTEGTVFWFGESSYASPWRGKYSNPYAGLVYTKSEMLLNDLGSYRVGFKDDAGNKHFCAATAVEVLAAEVAR